MATARNSRPGRPKKWLDQHFLHDAEIRRRIVGCLEIEPADRILEIGPGRGALTGFLAESGPGALAALEKDPELASSIAAEYPEVFTVCCDALKFSWERLGRLGGWKLIGNLPYNVASPLLWEIFSRAAGWSLAVFMVQKEVGRRLAAAPGGKSYGALSVWVQSFTAVKALFTVGPGAFTPPPKVQSMVLRFVPAPVDGRFAPEALAALLHLVFRKRRKQLGTILKEVWSPGIDAWLADQGLDRTVRPENLNPIQFQSLARLVFGAFRP